MVQFMPGRVNPSKRPGQDSLSHQRFNLRMSLISSVLHAAASLLNLALLVKLEEKLRVDHLEAETPSEVFVVLLRERPEHDALALNLRVQEAGTFCECDELVDGLIEHQHPELGHGVELRLSQECHHFTVIDKPALIDVQDIEDPERDIRQSVLVPLDARSDDLGLNGDVEAEPAPCARSFSSRRRPLATRTRTFDSSASSIQRFRLQIPNSPWRRKAVNEVPSSFSVTAKVLPRWRSSTGSKTCRGFHRSLRGSRGRAPSPSPHPDRQRRFPLEHTETLGDVCPSSVEVPGGRMESEKPIP